MSLQNSINAAYSAGTWTPAFGTTGTSPTTLTYTTQTGLYKLLNNICFIEFLIDVNTFSLGGGTGTLLLTGLPFTVQNNGFNPVCAISFVSITLPTIGLGTLPSSVVLALTNNTTQGAFDCMFSNTAKTNIALSGLTSSTLISGTGFYITA